MTITNLIQDLSAVRHLHWGTYTGPSSYAALGDPVVAAHLGLGHRVDAFLPGRAIDAAGAIRALVHDRTNATVRWYTEDGTEIVAAVDLSGFTAEFVACGI